MTLNHEYYPCPVDLDDSMNEYNTNLSNDSAGINKPYINSSLKASNNPNIESKEPIYVMTVELGDGNSEAIRIFQDSNPEELSFNFCKTHNLDYTSMNYLNEQLTALVQQYNKGNNDEAMRSIQEVDEEDFMSNRIKPSKMYKSNTLDKQKIVSDGKEDRNEQVNLERNKLTANFASGNNNQVNSGPEPGKFQQNNSYGKLDVIDINDKIEKKINCDKNNKKDLKNENNDFNTNVIRSNLHRLMKDKICSDDREKKNKNINKNTNLFTYEIYESENKKNQLNLNTIHKRDNNNSINTNKFENNKNRKETSSYYTTEKSQKTANEDILTLNNSNNLKGNKFTRLKGDKKSSSTNMESLCSQLIKPPENIENTGANSNILKERNNLKENRSTVDSNCTIYLDQIFQPISPIDKSLTTNRQKLNNGEVINNGERLYQKNMKLQQESRRKLDVYKKMKDMEYNSQYTYKPRINSKSAEIIKRRYENKIISIINNNKENPMNSLNEMLNDTYYFSAAWLENISNYDLYVEDKLGRLRKKHEKIEEYSFAPEINKNSKKIADEKFKSKLILQLQNKNNEGAKLDSIILQNARVNELYDKWRLRALKVDKMAENVYSQCTFKPQVNRSSNSGYLSLPFEQRQEIFKKKVEDNLERMEKLNYPMNFNREKIRSNSLNNHSNVTHNRPPNSNIFNNLYHLAEKYSQDKYNRAKLMEDEMIKNMHSVHTLIPSDQMIHKKKILSFKKIFRILDSDEDNSISSFYLDTSKLDKDILKIIQPILYELKEEQETLNEDEFVRACMHLYEPTIDKRSRQIAESKVLSLDFKQNQNERDDFSYSGIINSLNRQIDEEQECENLNSSKINIAIEKEGYILNLKEDSTVGNSLAKSEAEFNIDSIKSIIDKKYKKSIRGIQIREEGREEKIYLPFKKEEVRESSIKKVFVSESQIKEAKNPEEKKKLLGVTPEELYRIKEDKKKGLIEMQRDLFSLPENLQVQQSTRNDHMENLVKLSAAGLIEVPLPLEDQLKAVEETEIVKKKVNEKSYAEELTYLKFLKKIQPVYTKSYKNDISSKKLAKLNNVFENVFVPEKSRRRKLAKERLVMENRKVEEQ